MSLINDMLRDLDSRNAASSERSGLTQHIRALPPPPQRRVHPLLLALLAATLGGAAVWLLMRPPETVSAMPAVPVADSLATAPATATPTADSLATPPAGNEPPNAATAPVAETPALRLDTQLEARPAITTPPAPTTVTAPAKPAAARSNEPVTPPVPAPVAITAKPVAMGSGAGTPHISKQPTMGSTPAEQAEAEYGRGMAAMRRGDNSEAGEALRSALRLAPTHIGARQALLGLLTEQQRWQDAESLALDGVGLLPRRSEWALLAARLMYERGEAAMALETLNQHAAAARQNADYQILHALLLQRAGRHADAAACYRIALGLRPNEGRWWFGLGRALDADHRESEARQAYEKARDSGNLPPELLQNVELRLRQP